MSECPCENCKYYTYGKQHPNPNAYDLHYCELRKQAISKSYNTPFHKYGQWLFPCGNFKPGYTNKKGGVE